MADTEDLPQKSTSGKKDKGKKKKKDRAADDDKNTRSSSTTTTTTTTSSSSTSSSSANDTKRAVEKKPMSSESCDGYEEEYALHKACWSGDVELVKQILSTKSGLQQLNKRDPRGNPPLHIAIHLRHKDVINALLSAGVDPTVKNGGGWNSLQEAVASAERETAIQVYVASMQEMQNRFYRRVPDLLNAIENIPDFYMELQWEFTSWVPLVSRFCPSDKYRIYKKGTYLRADTTLVGFQNFHWIRGNVSIIFSGRDSTQPGTIVSINHDKKTMEYYNNFRWKTKKAIERDIGIVFCRTLLKIDLQTDNVSFSSSMKGGWFNSAKKVREPVGEWEAEKMDVAGFKYVTKHRTDTTKQKDQPRLPRDEPPALSFDEYFDFDSLPEDIGKGNGLMYQSEKFRQKVRDFKGNIWFSNDFPLSVEQILPVLELLSPTGKHFQKMKTFVEMKLPKEAGFPVKIEIPVLPTIVGTVTFLHFEEKKDIDPGMFRLPTDYLILV